MFVLYYFLTITLRWYASLLYNDQFALIIMIAIWLGFQPVVCEEILKIVVTVNLSPLEDEVGLSLDRMSHSLMLRCRTVLCWHTPENLWNETLFLLLHLQASSVSFKRSFLSFNTMFSKNLHNIKAFGNIFARIVHGFKYISHMTIWHL